MSDDIIDGLEDQMNENDQQGETPVVPVTPVAASADPDVSAKTAADVLIENKPSALQVQILKAISARKLDHDDPVLDVYNCTGMAAEAASAAGKAAEVVQSSVSKIPDQIFDGAAKASLDVREVITDELKNTLTAGGQDLIKAIIIASNKGASDIKAAAAVLTDELDKAIGEKKAQGVDQFAQAASQAAIHAVKGAGMKRVLWSFSGVSLILVFTLSVGGGACWEYLSLTHRIAPTPIQQTASGPDCGWAVVKGIGRQHVCVLHG